MNDLVIIGKLIFQPFSQIKNLGFNPFQVLGKNPTFFRYKLIYTFYCKVFIFMLFNSEVHIVYK